MVKPRDDEPREFRKSLKNYEQRGEERGRAIGRIEGEAIGEAKGIEKIAIKMLETHESLDKISELTGLSHAILTTLQKRGY